MIGSLTSTGLWQDDERIAKSEDFTYGEEQQTTGGVATDDSSSDSSSSAGDLTPEELTQLQEQGQAAAASLGMGNYPYYGGTNSSTGLPAVGDPDAAFARMTRQDYMNYVRDFRDFENELINRSQNDTSLIDAAREDTVNASALSSGIAERNAQRYGANLTPAQIAEQERAMGRASSLGQVQAVNNARLAQKSLNEQLQNDLINIGQGVNRSALSSMQSSAQNAVNLKNQYDQAKANSRAQTYSTIGSIGAAAIFALAF